MKTAGHSFIVSVFILAMFATRAPAPAQSAAANIRGLFSGTYDGPQGTTSFSLSLTEREGTENLSGVLTSHLAGSPDAVVTTNELVGFYAGPSRRFQLRSNIERTVPRGNRPTMVIINGTYDPNGGQLSGMLMVSGSRSVKFEAARGGTESSKATSTPAKTPSTAPIASPPAAPAQTTTTIDGVYDGTYTGGAGPRTLKLALRAFDHGTLTGIFTFYDPPTSHDRAYSFSMTGKFDAATGKFSLDPAKWLTPAPGYFMVGIAGTFDPNAKKVAGNLTSGRHGPFEATRDATASADIAKLIPSPAGAAAAATEMAGQLPVVQGPTATNVNGVYTGYVGCTSGKMDAKVSLKATGLQAVTGFLTVKLPPDVGSTATYKLAGTWHLGVVHVDSMPLGTPAPFNYAVQWLHVRNTEGMGVIATHLRGDVGSRSNCEIDVSRDDAQSATLDDVMAAQSDEATNPETLAKAEAHKQELATAQAAASKKQAEMIKTAAPTQVASKDVVRKSRQYWDAFRTDLIREVFDGGFGSGLGDDAQFEILFTHYVEAFSTDCRDALPAKHESVTITQTKVERDAFGVVHTTDVQTWTVECDSRFAPYYKDYVKSLHDRALALAVPIAAGKKSMGSLTDQVEDIERFFKNEKSRSAAMRQFTENLLRAAEDKYSLQQAGEKIAGAAAETDPNLPPGRYARFVDGCNGWFRDPANAYYRTAQSSAWCQCMGDKYQHMMNRDEEYYYANDFGRRFRDTIAQPHSTDPSWQRLHRVAEDCRQ